MFTIIIATHDRPQLLHRTLASLAAQTFQDFKVIIVTDSAAYIAPYQALHALAGRFTYVIRSGEPGPAASRNLGLALVDSEYVLFLDDDDTYQPGHLQALAAQIGSSRPELLFHDFQVQNEERTSFPPELLSTVEISIADVTAGSVYVRNRIPNSCIAYRRDVVASQRFAEDLILYEDWDFLLACLKGRQLRHAAIDTVTIHKSAATAPENMRRGNSRNEHLANVTLQLYRKHPAPEMALRLERQALLASAGVTLTLDHF